jgi:hypothetical protein
MEQTKRIKIQIDIFIALTKLMNRDNKIYYCDEHALERAKIIENSLYRICNNNDLIWEDAYDKINIEKLVNSAETKTKKCVYKISNKKISL